MPGPYRFRHEVRLDPFAYVPRLSQIVAEAVEHAACPERKPHQRLFIVENWRPVRSIPRDASEATSDASDLGVRHEVPSMRREIDEAAVKEDHLRAPAGLRQPAVFFYVQDREWGPVSIKVGTYLPALPSTRICDRRT